MVVFSNRRLGPSNELLLSPEVAAEILTVTAAAAAPRAAGRWEHELVRWLADPAAAHSLDVLDIGDIAWTPDHFEAQRRFLASAIAHAIDAAPEHAGPLRRWQLLVDAHPRDSVQVGRRWLWRRPATATG